MGRIHTYISMQSFPRGISAAVEVPSMYLKNSFLLCIKYLTYGTPYDILYTGGEKQMSNRNRKHPEKKKSDIDWKSWLLGVITDLTIGIILLILDKLLN